MDIQPRLSDGIVWKYEKYGIHGVIVLPNGWDLYVLMSEVSYGGRDGYFELGLNNIASEGKPGCLPKRYLGWLTLLQVEEYLQQINSDNGPIRKVEK